MKYEELTKNDRNELLKFEEYLRRVADVDKNKPGSLEFAYAETYGEVRT